MTSENSGCVDVVIPVYRGLDQTLRCIHSVLASGNRIPFEIVVIDDASPEPEVTDALRKLAGEERISLLVNDENLGFVRSVNRGMALHPDRDAVLLNSDCEVTGDWLDRLVACVAGDATIATATPFSNNATICSYPFSCKENELPQGWSLSDLDSLFASENAGRSVTIPTAVGSCMYVRRACWNALDGFDAQAFGLGYGEECDFSMRALAAGWKNVLCADVFVFHEGSVSFGARRLARIQAAEEVVNRRHPRYPMDVSRFVRDDPASCFRQAVSRARARRSAADAMQVIAELLEEQTIVRATLVAQLGEGARVRTVLETAVSEARLRGEQLDEALLNAERFVREREADVASVRTEAEHWRSEHDRVSEALREAQARLEGTPTAAVRRLLRRILKSLR